jgi:hypothetical protein
MENYRPETTTNKLQSKKLVNRFMMLLAGAGIISNPQLIKPSKLTQEIPTVKNVPTTNTDPEVTQPEQIFTIGNTETISVTMMSSHDIAIAMLMENIGYVGDPQTVRLSDNGKEIAYALAKQIASLNKITDVNEPKDGNILVPTVTLNSRYAISDIVSSDLFPKN